MVGTLLTKLLDIILVDCIGHHYKPLIYGQLDLQETPNIYHYP